ncbi:ABC transporter ATP-binding protein [[Limnothrix rosea] IAM M-220]|uniref:ABC transporter ATP-binding protein n=1 Tax=[Limnothrix rosea] IAM M-220 TaxID=454133 RepID=UPI00095FB35D|nr:ABC transporter ATP-binding protein [[Limnothrix rosea] IAM M-220]OKH13838.1 ABC transporter ATP-binding protein [[Limnothrix rosea] IAM M-220]
MTSTAVSLDKVTKVFGKVPVVNELSFDIQAGEMYGLLGPNGAGKSTTIRMLITLTEPSGGSIQVAGEDIQRNPAHAKRNIGVVLQQMSVDVDLTVWENLEFHGRLHHIPNPLRQRLIRQSLEYVELGDRRDTLVKTLSGGMKRRVQIARALLHEPKILFLDEPTVGLDPQTRRRLWEIIRELNNNGMTILLTTHYMEEAATLCDRIGIMEAGQLIEEGTVDELQEKYGRGLMIRQHNERWDYQFFPTVQEAEQHLSNLTDKRGVMVRESNLEDIFVELTGRQLD